MLIVKWPSHTTLHHSPSTPLSQMSNKKKRKRKEKRNPEPQKKKKKKKKTKKLLERIFLKIKTKPKINNFSHHSETLKTNSHDC